MLQLKEEAFIQMALQLGKTMPHHIRCGLQTGVCVHMRPCLGVSLLLACSMSF